MGTDIHVAVEVRRKGVWRPHRPTTPCRWYFETWDDQVKVDEANARMESYYTNNPKTKRQPPIKLGDRRITWDKCKTRLPDFFTDRDYLKFAILGNVRNGYGFGGVKTFDPLPPMSDARGFPPDMTPESKAKMSNERETWLTLAEMMAYDFSGELVEDGVVDEVTFLDCVINGTNPDSWSGGISGQGIEVVTPEQYLALYGSPRRLFSKDPEKPRTYDTTKRYFIQYRWALPLNTACPAIPEIIVYLSDLIPKGGTAEDVRMIFDFDS